MIWKLQTSAGTILLNQKTKIVMKTDTLKNTTFVRKSVEKMIKAAKDSNSIYTITWLRFNLLNGPDQAVEIEIFKLQL